MRNWSVDETQLKKHPEEYKLWRMEQLINYGLDGEKLDRTELKLSIDKLEIAEDMRTHLKFLLEN